MCRRLHCRWSPFYTASTRCGKEWEFRRRNWISTCLTTTTTIIIIIIIIIISITVQRFNSIMLHNSFSSDEEWPLQLFVLLLTLFLTLGIFTLEGINNNNINNNNNNNIHFYDPIPIMRSYVTSEAAAALFLHFLHRVCAVETSRFPVAHAYKRVAVTRAVVIWLISEAMDGANSAIGHVNRQAVSRCNWWRCSARSRPVITHSKRAALHRRFIARRQHSS